MLELPPVARSLVLTALASVPLCLLALGRMASLGPAAAQLPMAAMGVPFPFAHRAWLWAIACWPVLAVPPLVSPGSQSWPETSCCSRPMSISVQGNGGSLATATEQCSATWPPCPPAAVRTSRHATRPRGRSAAGVLIFAAVLSAWSSVQHRVGRIVPSACSGGLAALGHHATAQGRRSARADCRTMTRPKRACTSCAGQTLWLYAPDDRALAAVDTPCDYARPSHGRVCLAGGLRSGDLHRRDATELGPVLAGISTAADKQPLDSPPADLLAVDPRARRLFCSRVAGPAIGLMIVGGIGLLPYVFLILVAAFTSVIWPAHDVRVAGALGCDRPSGTGAAAPPILLAPVTTTRSRARHGQRANVEHAR